MGRKKRLLPNIINNLVGFLILIAVIASLVPVEILAVIAVCIGVYFIFKTRRSAVRVATLEELRALSPSGFERAIATLLNDMGYRNAKAIGGAGDLGADVTCVDGEGRKVVVQCKRYSENNKVTSKEAQLFIGMIVTEHHADIGIYATTSTFTKPAYDLLTRHGIKVWDGNKLADLLRKTGKSRR